MPTNTLTDARCKAAKPAEKAYKLFDGGGLHLYVSTTGARTWRLSYRLAGKPQTISFGPYPEVTLAEARTRRDEIKAVLRAGGDPMAARRSTRAAAGMTLRKASASYWASRKDLTPGYVANAEAGISNHLGGLLDRDVGTITRDDMLAELQRMDARGLYAYVRKVRMWSGQVFDWCVERRLMEVNPCALIRPEKAFGRKRVEHFASLPLREIPEFLQRLGLERDIQSVMACRLLAMLWVRTSELRMMVPAELDLDGKLWTINAGRMKKNRDHHVPLSDQAVAIIKVMLQRMRPGQKYLFGHPVRLDRPMSENAVLALIYRMDYKGRMTGHGWRTAASTWANEAGWSPDAIERQLSHAPDDKVRAAYNRAEYLAERRRMMQAWSEWLVGAGISVASEPDTQPADGSLG